MKLYIYHIRINNNRPFVQEYEVLETSEDKEVIKCKDSIYFTNECYKVQDIIPTSPFIYGLDLDTTINYWDAYQRNLGNTHLIIR